MSFCYAFKGNVYTLRLVNNFALMQRKEHSLQRQINMIKCGNDNFTATQ